MDGVKGYLDASGDNDAEDKNAELCFWLNKRLMHIYKSTGDWRLIACELYFTETGRREPDHSLETYPSSPAAGAASRTLRWLEGLDIPRSSHGQCYCSVRSHGWDA